MQILRKIFHKIYSFLGEAFFLLAIKFINIRINPPSLGDKKILIVIDEVSKRSRRFDLIAKHLQYSGWDISLLKTKGHFSFNPSSFNKISTYRNSNEAIYKIYKHHNDKIIFLITSTDLKLSFKVLSFFRKKVIYDPVDIWPENLNHEKASKAQIKISSKQRKVLFLCKNIVCRDLQLTSFGREIRKDKNIIFFPDYLDDDDLVTIKNKRSSGSKIKFVSIGNINTNDFLNGKAYADFIKLVNHFDHEFHFFLNQYHAGNLDLFYKENPFFDRKLKNVFLHDFISPDRVINQIKKFDYGLLLLGDHYYKKYNEGIWKKKLFFKNGSSRITDYIFSNLDIVLAKTKPMNYMEFFAKRYTNVLDFKEVTSLQSSYYIENCKKRDSLVISKQINRLDFFLSNICKTNQEI